MLATKRETMSNSHTGIEIRVFTPIKNGERRAFDEKCHFLAFLYLYDEKFYVSILSLTRELIRVKLRIDATRWHDNVQHFRFNSATILQRIIEVPHVSGV